MFGPSFMNIKTNAEHYDKSERRHLENECIPNGTTNFRQAKPRVTSTALLARALSETETCLTETRSNVARSDIWIGTRHRAVHVTGIQTVRGNENYAHKCRYGNSCSVAGLNKRWETQVRNRQEEKTEKGQQR
jgi:hypothetical protein